MTGIYRLIAGGGVAVASLALTAGAAFASTTVYNTGNHVTINSGSHKTTNVTVWNSNYGMVNQTADSTVNTGGNNANRNIGGGMVMTGNATVHNSFSAMLNNNWTQINF